jgi:hypothetical protein
MLPLRPDKPKPHRRPVSRQPRFGHRWLQEPGRLVGAVSTSPCLVSSTNATLTPTRQSGGFCVDSRLFWALKVPVFSVRRPLLCCLGERPRRRIEKAGKSTICNRPGKLPMRAGISQLSLSPQAGQSRQAERGQPDAGPTWQQRSKQVAVKRARAWVAKESGRRSGQAGGPGGLPREQRKATKRRYPLQHRRRPQARKVGGVGSWGFGKHDLHEVSCHHTKQRLLTPGQPSTLARRG